MPDLVPAHAPCRQTFRDGSRFETTAAYARGKRAGTRIVISGTAALDADGRALHPGDVHGQTQVALQRGLAAVAALGGRPEDVVLTRIYLVSGAEWRGAVEAHHEAFAGIDPANTTLYVAELIPEGALVEVELEAEVTALARSESP